MEIAMSAASLLHPTYGVAASDIRRAIGASRDGRTDILARQLDSTRRAMVAIRTMRGLYLPDSKDRITPDHNDYIEVVSSDDSVIREKGIGPHQLDLRVDPAIIPDPGCANALAGIVDCDGTTADITGCGDRLEFHDGTYVAAQKVTPDAPGNVAVRLDWCAPETDFRPPGLIGSWEYGIPDGWMILSVGDACSGGCAGGMVPFWNVPTP